MVLSVDVVDVVLVVNDVLQGVDVISVEFQELDVLALGGDNRIARHGVSDNVTGRSAGIERNLVVEGNLVGIKAGFKIVGINGDVDHSKQFEGFIVPDGICFHISCIFGYISI